MRATFILLLALLLAACSKGQGRPPCPAGKQCLEVANSSEPLTLDPSKAQLVNESNILYDLMIGLTTFDVTGHTVPGMAVSWETSPNGLTWTFHLRDAKWSDGVPVTAGDFVFGMRRLQEPRTASPYSYLHYLIAGAQAVNEGKAAPETMGVRAIDPRTLEIRLTHPAPYLPLLLIHSSGMPIPEHAVRRWGDAWIEPGHYVSNGAYALSSWALGDRITLVRNPYFYDDANVCFDRIDYFSASDPVSGERRIESGELDAFNTFSSNRLRYIQKHLAGYARHTPVFGIYYLSFNRHVPALADRRVRLALSMGVDREFITGTLLGSGQKPLYGFVPPGMSSHLPFPKPAWAAWPFARRQAVARRLLRQAGYGPDRPLRLELKYPNSGDKIINTALQADWRAIGAEINLAPVETQILYSELNVRAFEIALDSWYEDFDDPTTFLQLLSSSAGPQNHGDYANPRYDALLAAADEERDSARRARLLSRAEQVAMADAPVAPIYVTSGRNLVNPALTGWIDSPADFHPKRFLCRKGMRPGG